MIKSFKNFCDRSKNVVLTKKQKRILAYCFVTEFAFAFIAGWTFIPLIQYGTPLWDLILLLAIIAGGVAFSCCLAIADEGALLRREISHRNFHKGSEAQQIAYWADIEEIAKSRKAVIRSISFASLISWIRGKRKVKAVTTPIIQVKPAGQVNPATFGKKPDAAQKFTNPAELIAAE